MKHIMKFVKAHKKAVIIVGLLLIAVCILAVVQNSFRDRAQDILAAPDTTTLLRNTLEQIVTATGMVQYVNKQIITAPLNYKIKEVKAQIGDVVEAGDTLCILDTAELDRLISDTNASIASAQAIRDAQIEQAKRRLSDANEQRERANDAYNSAIEQADSNAKKAADSDPNIVMLKEAMDLAESAWGTDPGNIVREEAYEQAKTAYEAAWKSSYDAAYAAGTVPAQDALRNADINVQTNRDNLTNLELNDSTQSMRTQLSNYLKNKADAVIKAPVGGTVTAANVLVGNIATGALFTIEDPSVLEVTAVVPEYDMIQLSVGLPVNITTDATGDKILSGTISKISPIAVDSNGNFQTTVAILSSDNRVKSGMSAKLRIIVDSKENIFAVPYDAVITNDAGETIVVAYDKDAPAENRRTEISVTTGMETDYYVEINGPELKEALVILNDPEGKTVEAGRSNPFGNPFGVGN